MNRTAGLAAALLLGGLALSRAADPMTFQELSLRLKMGDTPQILLDETARRKLLEPLTPEQETALKNAGAAPEWIAAINAPSLAAPPEAAAAFRARKQQQQRQAAAVPALPSPRPVSTPAPVGPEQLRDADIIKVGDHAPAFSAKTADGKLVSQDQPARRLTLLTIISTASPACLQELEIFQASLQPKLATAGVSIVALGSGNTAAEMAELGRKLNLSYTLAEDPQKEITKRFARNYVPRCYVIDKHGLVKYASVGLNKEDLLRMINVINSELR